MAGKGRVLRGAAFPIGATGLVALVVSLSTPGLAAQDWSGRARVDGRVTTDEGTGLGGATVSFRRPDGQPGPEITTGPDGRFSVDDIAMGAWTLEIEAAGYQAGTVGLHLPAPSSWLGPVEVRLAAAESEPVALDEEPVRRRGVLPAGDDALSEATLSEDPLAASPLDVEPEGYAAVEAALEGGRTDRALKLTAILAPRDEGSADLLFAIGRGFLKAGETEEAITFFGRALERDPGHLAARYARALGLLALGRHDAAREDLETVRDLGLGEPMAEKARQALSQLIPGPEHGPPEDGPTEDIP